MDFPISSREKYLYNEILFLSLFSIKKLFNLPASLSINTISTVSSFIAFNTLSYPISSKPAFLDNPNKFKILSLRLLSILSIKKLGIFNFLFKSLSNTLCLIAFSISFLFGLHQTPFSVTLALTSQINILFISLNNNICLMQKYFPVNEQQYLLFFSINFFLNFPHYSLLFYHHQTMMNVHS